MSTTHKDIHTAIAAIYGSINGYVQKTKSEGLRYSFASEADLIAKLRPAFVEHGVSVSVREYRDVERSVVTTAKGGTMNVCLLKAIVRFTHASSTTFIDVEALGEGADSGDKAGNKAMTCAYKYALRQTFAIETGDDPDRDQDNVYQQRVQRPGEHASWAKDEAGFTAWLDKQGWAYDVVAAFCESLGKPAPAGMTNEQRRGLSVWMTTGGAETWRGFLAGAK